MTEKKDLIFELQKSKDKFQKLLTDKSLGTVHTEIKILKDFYIGRLSSKISSQNPNGYCGLKGFRCQLYLIKILPRPNVNII